MALAMEKTVAVIPTVAASVRMVTRVNARRRASARQAWERPVMHRQTDRTGGWLVQGRRVGRMMRRRQNPVRQRVLRAAANVGVGEADVAQPAVRGRRDEMRRRVGAQQGHRNHLAGAVPQLFELERLVKIAALRQDVDYFAVRANVPAFRGLDGPADDFVEREGTQPAAGTDPG